MPKLAFVIFVVAILQFLSCQKPETIPVENLSGNVVGILGHGGRGQHFMVPQNSLASVKKALTYEGVGFEIDVQLTQNNAIAVFHDKYLDGSTKCEGMVRNFTTNAIIDCEYSSSALSRLRATHNISMLEKILHYATKSEPKTQISLDVKLYADSSEDRQTYIETFAKRLVETVEAVYPVNKVFIECPNAEFLKTVQELNPDLRLFAYQDFEQALRTAVENGFYGITLAHKKTNSDQVKLAHSKNIRVMLFGIGSTSSVRAAISYSPDYIQVENIPNALNVQYE